ncbi:MAG TPA: hypothetical protein VHA34_04500 [Actinomycetes bacterium]|nr:hypothetical protein [Actinomycetes bacterium]
MIKKIIATLAIVAGVALFGAMPASADSVAEITLNPGQRYCLQEYYPAYYQAQGHGQVVSGHDVRFTFGSNLQPRLADTFGPAPGFYAAADRYTHPAAFPGYFRVCAINPSLKVSTVYLSVSSY